MSLYETADHWCLLSYFTHAHLHMCPVLWRPTLVACLWTRVGWWCHLGAYHPGASSPLVLSLRGSRHISWLARWYRSYGSDAVVLVRFSDRPGHGDPVCRPTLHICTYEVHTLCSQVCGQLLLWLPHQTIADLPTWLVVQPASRLNVVMLLLAVWLCQCLSCLVSESWLYDVVPGSLDVLRLSGRFSTHFWTKSSMWPLLLVLPHCKTHLDREVSREVLNMFRTSQLTANWRLFVQLSL